MTIIPCSKQDFEELREPMWQETITCEEANSPVSAGVVHGTVIFTQFGTEGESTVAIRESEFAAFAQRWLDNRKKQESA